MKPIVKSCLALLAAALLLRDASAEEMPRAKIAVFGGSFSVIEASRVAKDEWCSRAYAEYDDYGVSGAGFLSESPDGKSSIIHQVARALASGKNYDAFVIWASTNDMWGGDRIAEQNAAIEKCIGRIREARPGAKIMFLTSLPTPLTPSLRIADYGYGQEDTCLRLGVPVLAQHRVVVFPVGEEESYFSSDNLHPNESGYAFVKDLQADFIRKTLREGFIPLGVSVWRIPYVIVTNEASLKTDYVPKLTDTVEVDFKSSKDTQFALFLARQTYGSMDLCLFNITWSDSKAWRLDLSDTGPKAGERCAANVRMSARYEAGTFSVTTSGVTRTILDRASRVAALGKISANAPLAFFASYSGKDDACSSNYMTGDVYGMKIWNAEGELVREFVPAVDESGAVGFYETVNERFWTSDNDAKPFKFAIPATHVWTGAAGTGVWSDGGNWDVCYAPFTGCSVSFTVADTNAISVKNDIAGLRLKKIAVIRGTGSPSGGKVTLYGERLTLTGSGDCSPVECRNTPFECFAPLAIDAGSTADAQLYAINKAATFRGGLDVVSARSVGMRTNWQILFEDNPVVATDSALYGLMGGGTTYFNVPVAAKSVTCLVGGHHTTQLVFAENGNSWDDISVVDGGRVCFTAEGAVSTNTVFSWGTDSWPQSGNSGHYEIRADQTADRIESVFPRDGSGNEYDTFIVKSDTDAVRELTLRGTANATCSAKLTDKVSIVWDPVGDYTQMFVDRRHTTTGPIIVRGGTLKMSGTNTFANVPKISVEGGVFEIASTVDGCLAGVRTLVIGATGRLRIASDATLNPFTTSELSVDLDAGGVIEAPAGATFAFKKMLVGGVALDPSVTYVGIGHATSGETEVGWIDGAGRVTAANANITSWKSAATGDWSDADNWTAGVPGDATETYVCAEGGSYEVRIGGSIALPRTFTCRGGDVRVVVKPGGVASYNGTGKTADILIADGAEVKVDGGTLAVSNFAGNFVVQGSNSSTGRISVVSGEFRYAMRSDSKITLKSGGEMSVSGGSFVSPCQGNYGNLMAVGNYGGSFSVTGTGVVDAGIDASVNTSMYQVFGTGRSALSGNAYWKMGANCGTLAVVPAAAGDCAELSFSGHASYTNYPNSLLVGQRTGARAILSLDSDGIFGKATWDGAMMAYQLCVGVDAGYGEFNLSRGFAPIYKKGLRIGAASSTTARPTEVEGVVRVSGGVLVVHGTEEPGYECNHLNGLVVGDGGFADTSALSGRPFKGRMELSGGAVTNRLSASAVGVGFATGTLLQAGGEFINASDWPHVVGLAGGDGLHVMSNGTFVCRGKVFVGGAATNELSGIAGDLVPKGKYPIGRHDAKGRLVFAGGEFVADGPMVVGADGEGIVERIGADGGFAVGGLVLTNTAENIDSGATLKFTFDPVNGVKPIVVNGALEIATGSELEIDLGSYDGNGCTLIKANSVSGAFASQNVVIAGECAGHFELKHTDTGLRLSSTKRGVIMIVW